MNTHRFPKRCRRGGVAITFFLLVHIVTQAGASTACADPTDPSYQAPELQLPLDYVQSAFGTADCQTSPTDNPGLAVPATRSIAAKAAELDRLTPPIAGGEPLFTGGEIIISNLRSDAGRADVREFAQVLHEASSPGERPRLGYYSPPRLPGFFFPDEIDSQPTAWRAEALRSDGSTWTRLPSFQGSGTSWIQSSGNVIDITNEQAVSSLLQALGQVMDADCGSDACIGPMQGFVAFNEWKLTPAYRPFDKDFERNEDLVPNGRVALDCDVDTAACRRDAYLPWANGHPLDLLSDGNPQISFLLGPKRAIPLYSQSARDSFVRFVDQRRISAKNFQHLPADRSEFNAACADIANPPDWLVQMGCEDPQLPAHVKFVPTSNTEYWDLWEDWVFDTWTSYFIRVADEIVRAQEGNPAFFGNLHFVPSWWGAIRANRQTPIHYEYFNCPAQCQETCNQACYDCSNGQVQRGQITLGNLSYFDQFNPVVTGNDLDRLLASDAFAGLIHETTLAQVYRVPYCLQNQVAEHWLFTDNERFRATELAKGALLRRIAHANNKLFGSFARSQKVAPQQHGQVLEPQAFKESWERTVDLLNPDLVSTIAKRFYLTGANPDEGTLQAAWAEKITAFRLGYNAPDLRFSRSGNPLGSGATDTLPTTPPSQPLTVTYDLANLLPAGIVYPSDSPGTLTISDVSVTSPNFQIVETPPLWLTPGRSAPLKIRFLANPSQSSTGILRFSTNAPGAAPFTLQIQGRIGTTTGQAPYLGDPVSLPAETVQAENFDLGGPNIAYFDTTPANNGGAYRDEEVDIFSGGGRIGIGWTPAGEWLEYTVDVTTAGTYRMILSAASPAAGGRTFALAVDGNQVLEGSVPNTGAWGLYQTVTVPGDGFYLGAGEHILRLEMTTGQFNLDWFRFEATGDPVQGPFGGSPVQVPSQDIEAEDFDLGGPGLAYNDTTPENLGGQYRDEEVDIPSAAGGFAVGWTAPGEWLEYTVDVDASATYELEMEVASAFAGNRSFSLQVDGVTALSNVVVPLTGSWGQFQTFSAGQVTLDEGVRVIRISMIGGAFNFDRFRFVEASQVIAWDDFSGGTSGQLLRDRMAPSGQAWQGNASAILGNGVATALGADSTPVGVLPLPTFSVGDRVKIKATIQPTESNWTAIGFTSNHNGGWWTHGRVWALVRSNGTYSLSGGGASLGGGTRAPIQTVDAELELEITGIQNGKYAGHATLRLDGDELISEQAWPDYVELPLGGWSALLGDEDMTHIDDIEISMP